MVFSLQSACVSLQDRYLVFWSRWSCFRKFSPIFSEFGVSQMTTAISCHFESYCFTCFRNGRNDLSGTETSNLGLFANVQKPLGPYVSPPWLVPPDSQNSALSSWTNLCTSTICRCYFYADSCLFKDHMQKLTNDFPDTTCFLTMSM